MQKQFEQFQKMNVKEACKAIEDMTYSYINPTTNEPTAVPAKHYQGILEKTVEQFLDRNLKIEMLDNVYKQLIFLQKEYGKDFIKSLLCLDLGIKPSDMSIVQSIAIEEVYDYVQERQNDKKYKFNLLRQEIHDNYKEAAEDKQLHTQYIKGNFGYDKEIENEYDVDY